MRGRGIAVGEMNTELLYLNKSWEGLNSLPGTVKHTTCLHGRKTGHYHHLPPWLQALCGRGRGGGPHVLCILRIRTLKALCFLCLSSLISAQTKYGTV